MEVQAFLCSLLVVICLTLQSAISAPGYDVWIEDTESGSGEIMNEIVETTQLFTTKVPVNEVVHVTHSTGPSVNKKVTDQNPYPDSKTTYSQRDGNDSNKENSVNMASGLMIGLLVASVIFVLTTLALVAMVIYRYRKKMCASQMGKINITYTASREMYFKPTTNDKSTNNVSTTLENPTYMKC